MTRRNCFLDYVKHGSEYPLCSLQIGAGAGYDTKIAGREWVSETTLADTIATVTRYDMVPLFNIGIPGDEELNPLLKWKVVRSIDTPEFRQKDYELSTPYGTLTKVVTETPRHGVFQSKYPVACDADLRPFEWVVDAMADGDASAITRRVAECVRLIDGRGALSVQWAMQPYEMLCYPNVQDTMLLTFDHPEFMKRMMRKIIALSDIWQEAVKAGGGDFVFIGGSSRDMINPDIFERFLTPGAREVIRNAHEKELLVYSHVCSPVEPFLSMGYYNQWGVDLFETLSPPPVGNVDSLEHAMEVLDPVICTRGNLGLDVLLRGTPDEVRRGVQAIREATRGRKHIIAASDYLFYDIPEENVIAFCEAANA